VIPCMDRASIGAVAAFFIALPGAAHPQAQAPAHDSAAPAGYVAIRYVSLRSLLGRSVIDNARQRVATVRDVFVDLQGAGARYAEFTLKNGRPRVADLSELNVSKAGLRLSDEAKTPREAGSSVGASRPITDSYTPATTLLGRPVTDSDGTAVGHLDDIVV